MSELERCKSWIESALEHSGGTHNFDDICEGVKEGRMQLWPGKDGCVITELVSYPRIKTINVFLGAGKLDQLTDMHESVIAWAKLNGAKKLTMSGRFGWERALKKHGWKFLQTTMYKEF